MFAGATPARIGAGGSAVFDASWPRRPPTRRDELATAATAAGCAPSTGGPGHLRRAQGPGWALVGDAGYWKDPIGAHGLTDALRDAELLARAVAGAAAEVAWEAAPWNCYHETRHQFSTPLSDVVETIVAWKRTDAEMLSPLLDQLG